MTTETQNGASTGAPTQNAPEEWTLPSGLVVTLKMPPFYQMLTTSRGVPNPAVAAVLALLAGEGHDEAVNEMERLKALKARMRGLYEVAAMCMVTPKVRLDLKDGEQPHEGEISPDDLGIADLEHIYFGFFRNGAGFAARSRARRSRLAANTAPAGDDLSGDDAGGTSGD